MKRLTIRNSDGSVLQPTDLNWAEALEKLAAYEDTGLTPEEAEIMRENKADAQFMLTELCSICDYDRLYELAQADKNGKLVVLPFAQGEYLVDKSYPERPELLENFRVALAYDCRGIVFHQPFNMFLENVRRGYIGQISEEAEKALEEVRHE